MARILFSGLVDSMAGKLAGSVIQNSYGGYQLRTRVVPRNPQTDTQQTARNRLISPSQAWRSLSSTSQDTWITAATPTTKGFHLYVSSNNNLKLCQQPAITDYIDSALPDEFPIEISSSGAGSIVIRAIGAVTSVPVGTTLLIQGTVQQPPNRRFYSPTAYQRLVNYTEGVDFSTGVDIALYYFFVFGTVQSNMTVSVKASLVKVSNGLRTLNPAATAVTS